MMMTVLFLAALAQDFPGDMPLSRVLVAGEGWREVAQGFTFAQGLAVDREGNVFLSDIQAQKIHKVDLGGKLSLFAENTARTTGLMFGPDGRLYGCREGEKKIVAYAMDGNVQTIAEDVESHALVVNAAGEIWFTDPEHGRIGYLPAGGKPRVVAEHLRPIGLILTPDQGTLLATDSTEPALWAFRVETDGSLKDKDRYCQPLRMVEGQKTTGAEGMTFDKAGRIYVSTQAGLEMFDPTGRLGGVIAKPEPRALSYGVVFGGPEFAYLYVTSKDKLYRRKTKSPGEPYFLRAKK